MTFISFIRLKSKVLLQLLIKFNRYNSFSLLLVKNKVLFILRIGILGYFGKSQKNLIAILNILYLFFRLYKNAFNSFSPIVCYLLGFSIYYTRFLWIKFLNNNNYIHFLLDYYYLSYNNIKLYKKRRL